VYDAYLHHGEHRNRNDHTQVDQWCGDECGCDTSVPLTWMPGRTGALSALTESLDLSNIVDTFNSALQSASL